MTYFKMYLFFPTVITKLAHFSKQSPEESMVTEIKKSIWDYGKKNLMVSRVIILACRI